MLVSVITVCYNSENTIRKTIESVLAQTYDHIEYIIVDGESKDNTLLVAKEYTERFAQRGYTYRIISEKDKGIYDAMNKGIRVANGELIGIINSDDWYEPIAVQTAAEEYLKEPYGLFYADLNLVKADGSVIVKHSKQDKYPSTRHWNHPTSFIPKKTYEQYGAYLCETLYDDFDLILRLRRANVRTVIKNVVLANFRTGGVSTQKRVKQCIERMKARYGNYRRNGYSRLYIFESVAMEVAKFILS